MIHEHASLVYGSAVDSQATLYVRVRDRSHIAEISGSLRGPHCKYARSLAADYPLSTTDSDLATILVTDPCFWTPTLPFLYDLNIKLITHAGEEFEEKVSIGLRRWAARGEHLFLEGRRTVVRGIQLDEVDSQQLHEARAAEIALLVPCPDQAICFEASHLGVMLLADLTSFRESLQEELYRLSWVPAVMMVVVAANQLQTWDEAPDQLVAQLVLQDVGALPSADVLLRELPEREQPLSQIDVRDKPVIALRKGATYADMESVRAECDLLQSDLAPHHDLAGYLIGS